MQCLPKTASKKQFCVHNKVKDSCQSLVSKRVFWFCLVFKNIIVSKISCEAVVVEIASYSKIISKICTLNNSIKGKTITIWGMEGYRCFIRSEG